MMIRTAIAFEKWQSKWIFSWYADSGFSAGDLVPDLSGFYRVIRPIDLTSSLQPVSKAAALKRWDYYGPVGNYKNETFKPLLFPDPDKIYGKKNTL